MNIKPLVAALAALSLTGAAFAGQAVQQQQTPKQARHTSKFAPKSALSRALNGNSYAGYLRHNHLNGHHGMWIAGFGQLVGTYNTNYLLRKHHHGWSPLPNIDPNFTPTSNTTIGLPHADVLFGYDSHSAGFVVDAGYSDMPSYNGNTANSIVMSGGALEAREAYMTYRINNMIGVKAGKFESDFGSYDPTQPLLSLTTALEAQNVVGIEGVVATHGFHGSVTAAMKNGVSKTSTSSGLTNDARPNTFIVNGGYDMPFRGATVGIQGSFDNKSVKDANGDYKAAWTVGAHYGNGTWTAKVDLLNQRVEDANGKKPWVFSGSVDYKLGKHFGHGMVVGGYGDYIDNPTTEMENVHWILGAKFGYCVNKFIDATAYLQQAQQKSGGTNKNNTTAMLALSVKV